MPHVIKSQIPLTPNSPSLCRHQELVHLLRSQAKLAEHFQRVGTELRRRRQFNGAAALHPNGVEGNEIDGVARRVPCVANEERNRSQLSSIGSGNQVSSTS